MVQDSVIGLAWVSGMCHPEFSCTINEGHNYESVYVIAHEMGHNLGTDMQATSDDIAQYSTCFQEYFKSVVDSMFASKKTNDSKHRQTWFTCLPRHGA